MKLKYKEIKDWRIRQLGIQDYSCALCGDIIEVDEAVLDHDHKSGFVRQVLHRGCNAMLGKIENNLARNKMDLNRLEVFAGNLVEYLTTQHTEIQHPTFLTTQERKMKAYKKKKKPVKPGKGRY